MTLIADPAIMETSSDLHHLSREQRRQTFVEEAYASWIAYQNDGLHLTLEETCAWLDTWGSAEEELRPTCHR